MGWIRRHRDPGHGHDHSHGLAVRPILPVRDLDEAEAVPRGLGLDVQRHDDTYAWVRHDGHELWHLRVVEDLDPATNHANVYVFVDDVESWHARATGAGLDPTPVRDEPWGMREFAVTDPSGNRLRLGRNA